jgi:hypothetical protein
MISHSIWPSIAAQIVVNIFYLLSMLFAVYLLFKTALTDPGIIPRKIEDPNSLEPKLDIRNIIQPSSIEMGRNDKNPVNQSTLD